MSRNDAMDVIDALDDLLEAERAALLSGKIDEVGRLLTRKEALIDELSTLEGRALPELQTLSNKVKRNQDLLDHALEGIRTVARRLASLRRVRSALDTYDARGARHTIDITPEASVEKRA